jgi:hypothetical protein
MPFEKAEDHALGNPQNEYCAYCTHPDGTLKSYDEILLGTTEFLIQSQGVDKNVAEAIARETLQNLPAWKP